MLWKASLFPLLRPHRVPSEDETPHLTAKQPPTRPSDGQEDPENGALCAETRAFLLQSPAFFLPQRGLSVYVPHVLTYGSGLGAHPGVTETQRCAHITPPWSPQGRRPPFRPQKAANSTGERRMLALHDSQPRSAKSHLHGEKVIIYPTRHIFFCIRSAHRQKSSTFAA